MTRFLSVWSAVCCSFLLLAGCGLKGPLYLPPPEASSTPPATTPPTTQP